LTPRSTAILSTRRRTSSTRLSSAFDWFVISDKFYKGLPPDLQAQVGLSFGAVCVSALLGGLLGGRLWLAVGPRVDPSRLTLFAVRKRVWLLVSILPLGMFASVIPLVLFTALLNLRLIFHWLVHPALWLSIRWWLLAPIATGLILGVPLRLWMASLAGVK